MLIKTCHPTPFPHPTVGAARRNTMPPNMVFFVPWSFGFWTRNIHSPSPPHGPVLCLTRSRHDEQVFKKKFFQFANKIFRAICERNPLQQAIAIIYSCNSWGKNVSLMALITGNTMLRMLFSCFSLNVSLHPPFFWGGGFLCAPFLVQKSLHFTFDLWKFSCKQIVSRSSS